MGAWPGDLRFWFEDHWGDGWSGWAADPALNHPLACPMVRVDVGMTVDAAGHMQFAEWPDSPGMLGVTEDQQSTGIVNRVRFILQNRLRATSVYGLVIVGTDAADRIRKVVRHPDDLQLAGIASFCPVTGIAQASAYWSNVFAQARVKLRNAGLPMPSFLFVNSEALGDVGGAAVELDSIMRAHPLYRTYLVDGVNTAAKLRESPKDIAGDMIATPAGGTNVNYPDYWHFSHLIQSIYQRSVAHAYTKAIVNPFRVAFGKKLPAGEWQMFTASREHPVPVRPGQFMYQNGGFLGEFSHAVPAFYSSPVLIRSSGDDPLASNEPRWEVPKNWRRFYGLQDGGNFFGTLAASGYRNGVAVIREQLALGKRVCPSLSINSVGVQYNAVTGLDEELPTRLDDLAEAMPWQARLAADAWRMGVRDFWMFSPGMRTFANDRRWNALLLNEIAARVATKEV